MKGSTILNYKKVLLLLRMKTANISCKVVIRIFMNTDLSFITNEANQSLKERFEVLIRETSFFDCLVGYFYSSGFYAIYPSLKSTEKIRILIGISTNRQTFEMMKGQGKPPHQTFDFSHAEAKHEVGNLVQNEM